MSILEFSMLVILSVHLAEWCIKPGDTKGDATFFFKNYNRQPGEQTHLLCCC